MTKIKLVQIFSEKRNRTFFENNLCCIPVAIKVYVMCYEFMTHIPIIIENE